MEDAGENIEDDSDHQVDTKPEQIEPAEQETVLQQLRTLKHKQRAALGNVTKKRKKLNF